MQPDWLIIDGYNLLHQAPDLQKLIRTDLSTARHRLIRLVENTAHRMAQHITIVFDGRESGTDTSLSSRYLEIHFSPTNLSADTIIERLVFKHDQPGNILVVTSDHAEHATVSSAGAQVMSAKDFLARCLKQSGRTGGKRIPPGKEPRLGDLFPDGL